MAKFGGATTSRWVGVRRPRGDLCKLRVDAIVNSTNESVNEVNGLSERIVATAGREIYDEIQALEGCRTGEAKMTAGFNLPARWARARGDRAGHGARRFAHKRRRATAHQRLGPPAGTSSTRSARASTSSTARRPRARCTTATGARWSC